MRFYAEVKTYVLNLLFPIACFSCKEEGAYLCPTCREALPMLPPACFACKKLVPQDGKTSAGRTCKPCRKKSFLYASFSPFSYGHPVIRDALHYLKYRRARGAAPLLGEMLFLSLAFYQVALPEDALLIPIPLHKSRERTRGFNQSHLIAQELAQKLHLTFRTDILKKIKKTAPQMELSREARLMNLAGAFAVSDADAVRNRTCILVDDVKTTGATMEEAARVLKNAGAGKIWAITVAR